MLELPWLFFIGASLAVIIAPGQDMVLVMSRGLGQGALAGIVTGAGVSLGLMCHTVLATLGLGALLQTSELAFTILKYAGAAYLAYLGLRLLAAGAKTLDGGGEARASYVRLFTSGALSNLSNPKIALFYFAFLPQFTSGAADEAGMQVFVLGTVFALLTFLVKVPVGYFAGAFSGWFQRNPAALGWVYRISGVALIAISLKLALEERA